jgi:hypothetical protein
MAVKEAAGSAGLGRAAQELQLKRGEFDLARQLGIVRTTTAEPGGPRRVSREEIARLRAADGFPDSLRERVRTLGTADGAELMGISPARFTRLARVGCVIPATLYLNRYRAVVWLYLADELRAFAAEQPALLTGRSPASMLRMLNAGEDRRARNWRGRRLGRLLRQAEDPWERAAVAATALDPVQLAEVVDDPFERAYLCRLGPEPPVSPGAAGQVLYADHPDEILWHRVSLVLFLDDARASRPAPRPGDGPEPAAPTLFDAVAAERAVDRPDAAVDGSPVEDRPGSAMGPTTGSGEVPGVWPSPEAPSAAAGWPLVEPRLTASTRKTPGRRPGAASRPCPDGGTGARPSGTGRGLLARLRRRTEGERQGART